MNAQNKGSHDKPIALFLSRVKQERLEYEDGGREILSDSNIALFDPTGNFDSIKIAGSERPQNGSIYLLDQYNGNYVKLENADVDFTRSKIRATAEIARLLGAKRFYVNQEGNSENDRNFQCEGGAQIAVKALNGKIDSTYSKEFSEKIRGKIEVEQTFQGGPANIEDARRRASQLRFNDDDIQHLISQRESSNPIKSFKLKIEIFKEINSLWSSITKIQAGPRFMANLFTAELKVRRETRSSDSLFIEMVLDF